jgi:ketosteroid isomerase-like protein
MSHAQWGPARGVRSVEQFRAWWREITGMWESARLEVDEYIDLGQHIVTPLTGRFRGRDGVEVQARTTWLWTFRDGAIQRITLYQERDEALEAAGLSE